ncbi:BCAS3 microtubule associated cell migration factor-like isoform X1 [Asterias amurensis]|uniref:BCAS3 microtubule associated cell migration factor-like isoform X1 n=1 Tax=Asterias amurensis TaxID=7602 RepID=UPI003AB18ED6
MAYQQSPSKRPASSSRAGGVSVRAQPVSDKSYMATVVDFLQDAYSGNKAEDKDKILWVKFEQCSSKGQVLNPHYINQEGSEEPIFLVIGYANGVQIWSLPPSGEAQEVLSLRQGPVRILRVLPTPYTSGIRNHQQDKRPLVALCDGASSSQPFCSVSLLSLKTGEQVHNIAFKTPVCDVLCNRRLIVVALQEKVAAFDAVSFKSRFCITSCYPASSPNLNPLALGSRWLAYADRKLVPSHQSGGGVCREAGQSYKATVIHAAKAITKGITAFSESLGKLATSKLSTSPPRQESSVDKVNTTPLNTKNGIPGIVTVIDTLSVEGEFNVTEDSSGDCIVAHFQAHINESISALAFDPSGSLLFTAGSQGHSFHIFRLMNHPCSSGLGTVHHLYVLYRGDTAAKVQDVSITNDSRWVAVSTMRETTHVFPITPYGGQVSSRTHTPAKIVNKESRFHKSAGLDELVDPGRGSPVQGLSESPTSSGFHSPEPISTLNQTSTVNNSALNNPRLPPYPPPVTVVPLAQIKQPAILASVGAVTGMTGNATRPRSACSQTAAVSDYVCISTCFGSSRGHFVTSSKGTREKNDATKQTAVDSLFIMGCHGNLAENILEPKMVQSGGRKTEETGLELGVTEHAQWNLQRGMNWAEHRPPLGGFNHLLLTNEAHHCAADSSGYLLNSVPRSESSDSLRSCHSSPDSDFDEPWLSQVEMVTHAGPHRRLWMGPQFKFKTVPQPSSTTVLSSTSSALLSDGMETNRTAMDMTQDDVDLKSLRPVVMKEQERRMFSCPECPKMFWHRASLTRHRQVDHDLELYARCDFRSARKDNLRRPYRQNHKEHIQGTHPHVVPLETVTRGLEKAETWAEARDTIKENQATSKQQRGEKRPRGNMDEQQTPKCKIGKGDGGATRGPLDLSVPRGPLDLSVPRGPLDLSVPRGPLDLSVPRGPLDLSVPRPEVVVELSLSPASVSLLDEDVPAPVREPLRGKPSGMFALAKGEEDVKEKSRGDDAKEDSSEDEEGVLPTEEPAEARAVNNGAAEHREDLQPIPEVPLAEVLRGRVSRVTEFSSTLDYQEGVKVREHRWHRVYDMQSD